MTHFTDKLHNGWFPFGFFCVRSLAASAGTLDSVLMLKPAAAETVDHVHSAVKLMFLQTLMTRSVSADLPGLLTLHSLP